MKQEMDTLRKRCERVEKEKSDILLRRLANIDSVNKYSSGRSSEVLKLQQKVNELTGQNEDLRDEKKHLSLKIREIESELEVSIIVGNLFCKASDKIARKVTFMNFPFLICMVLKLYNFFNKVQLNTSYNF